ncbi:bifunctional 4-hydroxy-2-oxoglutarate aldolase/2-dehydro-3-deoxy-phosphogluconate aldolase [Sphingomonas sp. RB1R13]|uniref:bifunctional 4-hydroxy-2-oxoglutarate aldolase/2-dehydro-3-deoxy-phosphogluconate aldolase n=1 Tax=Sphingomonas sp. RB1R13 TaxID=3096159 RepID=UPI002FCA0617
MTIDDLMNMAPVIPVLVLGDELDPAALAETLVAAGLPVIEVTLRTPWALDALHTMAGVTGAIVGAGTVRDPRMLDDALKAGAEFIVSPGLTEPLGKAAIASGVPFLPGTATAADIMRGLDMGLTRFKFFPAEAAGGRPALSALAGPFPELRFCPTGGIRLETAADWLTMEAVTCVGGSWIAGPRDHDLAAIGTRARAAAALAY